MYFAFINIRRVSLMRLIKNLTLLALSTALASNVYAAAEKERNFYVAGSIGISQPLQKHFKEKGAKFGLNYSPMFTADLGYYITPDIAVEFSFDYKNKYPVKIQLSQDDGGDIAKSKANSKIYMLNLVYNLKEFSGFTPFFTIGAGVAQVELKPTNMPTTIAGLQANKLVTDKHKSNSFAWQVGVGAHKKLTENFGINLVAKMQVAHNVKLKTITIDKDATSKNIASAMQALRMPSSSDIVYNKSQMKKTLGIGEFSIGFQYDLPF